MSGDSVLRLGRVAIGVAATLALAGCGAGSPTSVAGGEMAASAAAAESLPTPKAALRAALEGVRESRTGAFETKIRTDAGERVERNLQGAFDLDRDLWAAAMSMNSWTSTGGSGITYAADIVVTPGRYYQAQRSGVSPELMFKWGYVDTTGHPAAAPENLSPLLILGQVKARTIRVTKNGSVVTGTLPGASAVGLLGLGRAVMSLKLTQQELAGKADVTIDLDRAGHLARVSLSGKDVEFATSSAPAKIRDLVAGSEYTNEFSKLGTPVDIAVPASAERIEVDLAGIIP
jgi:hypothetical protein